MPARGIALASGGSLSYPKRTMETENTANTRFILLHGFPPEAALAILKAAKAAVQDPENVAAAMSTPNNMEWKLGDLISHVSEEHAWFREKGVPKPD